MSDSIHDPGHLQLLELELNEFLRSRLGPSVSITGDLTRLQGGWDTETYSFTLDSPPPGTPEKLVLRHFRHAGEARRVVRESTIQNAAAGAGHPVPSVPIDSIGILLAGRPFLVMERLPGTSLGDLVISGDPAAQQFPLIMAKLQAALHKIDTSGLLNRLEKYGIEIEHLKPSRLLQQINSVVGVIHQSKTDQLADWLNDRFPDQPERLSISHGDLHPNNILMHDGKVSGLIDWATTMFTHPEFDIAVSRSILSIGPPEDVGIPPEELQHMLDWATAEYMKHCHELQTIDDSLVDYYSALRLSHAYVKVHAKRLGIEHSEVAHEGYAWNAPKQYAAVTRMINEITGIELESA